MIPIPPEAVDQYTVAPSNGFIPDRLGVRQLILSVDRVSNQIRANITPTPCNESEWGPVDYPAFSTHDLLEQINELPLDIDRVTCQIAVQAITVNLKSLYALLTSNTVPPEEIDDIGED